MNTIHHYSACLDGLNRMTATINAIAYDFKETAPRNELDLQLIDGLLAAAAGMTQAAEALKTVEYDPTPEA